MPEAVTVESHRSSGSVERRSCRVGEVMYSALVSRDIRRPAHQLLGPSATKTVKRGDWPWIVVPSKSSPVRVAFSLTQAFYEHSALWKSVAPK